MDGNHLKVEVSDSLIPCICFLMEIWSCNPVFGAFSSFLFNILNITYTVMCGFMSGLHFMQTLLCLNIAPDSSLPEIIHSTCSSVAVNKHNTRGVFTFTVFLLKAHGFVPSLDPFYPPSAGFLCASKLRLHQRCKFIRQWLAKNHDSERTGTALLSVRAHHYLTHPGGPGDRSVVDLFFFLVCFQLSFT